MLFLRSQTGTHFVQSPRCRPPPSIGRPDPVSDMPARVQEGRGEVVAEGNRPHVPRALRDPAIGARNNAARLGSPFSTRESLDPLGESLRAGDVVVWQQAGTVLVSAAPLRVRLGKRRVDGCIRDNKLKHAHDSIRVPTYACNTIRHTKNF